MPKKSHGRTPKAKARSNRTAPRAAASRTPDSAAAVLTAGASTVPLATASPPVQRPAPTSSATRRSSTSGRMPVTVVNYAYLRHDLRLLALLAPAMIIVLVLAFIFLH